MLPVGQVDTRLCNFRVDWLSLDPHQPLVVALSRWLRGIVRLGASMWLSSHFFRK